MKVVLKWKSVGDLLKHQLIVMVSSGLSHNASTAQPTLHLTALSRSEFGVGFFIAEGLGQNGPAEFAASSSTLCTSTTTAQGFKRGPGDS